MKNIIGKLKKMLPYLVAAAVFILLAVVYCYPVLSGKVLRQGDIYQWKGMSHEVQEYFENTGHVSKWTGSMFSGMPAYQITHIPPQNGFVGLMFKVLTFLYRLSHFFFGSILAIIIGYFVGFYILIRSFDVNKWLSIVGSIAITLSSYFFIIIVAGHETKALTLGLMAPVIAGFYLIFQKKYLWGVCLTMLFTAFGLYAHPQMSYYIFMMIGVLAIGEIWQHIKEKRLKDMAIAISLFALSVLIGAGTGYGNYKSNSEYMKETMRGGHSEIVREEDEATLSNDSGLSFEYATQWSYGIGETFTLLIPNFKGGASASNIGTDSRFAEALKSNRVDPQAVKYYTSAAPTYWGEQPFTAGPVYVGAIVCMLFVLGLCIVKGPYKWGLLIATLFSVFLSWGHNFEWFSRLFFNYFPFYSKFRAVSSILVVAQIAMPLLGFLALKEIFERRIDARRLKRSLLIALGTTGGISLFFALFGGLIFSFTSSGDAYLAAQFPEWFMEALIDQRAAMFRSDSFRSFAFILLAALLILLFAKQKIKPALFVLLLGALFIADMWPVNRRYFNENHFVTRKENDSYFQKYAYEEEILKDTDPHFRVLNLTTNTFNESRTSYYLKSIGGYHAAKLRRYQDLIDEHLTQMNMNALNMLNTKYIIVEQDGEVVPMVNEERLGNAWFVDEIIPVETPNQESDMLRVIDPASVAVVDRKFSDFVTDSKTPADTSAHIELSSYAPDVLTYQSNCAFDKTAVFSEIYYPYGWKAYIDGTPVEHFRVNYLLRALNIPAGNHEIRFEFRPDSVIKGNIISAVFTFVMVAIIVASLSFACVKNRRNREETE